MFQDITETISLGELLQTSVSAAGVLLCAYLYGMRRRTYYDIIAAGINGETRLLARLRAMRMVALFLIFEIFTIMGLSAMLIPTNPALVPHDPLAVVSPLGIMAIQLLLLGKIGVEEIYEGTIARLIALREKAMRGETPRLSD